MDPRLFAYAAPVSAAPLDYRHYTYDVCLLGECLVTDEICADYECLPAITMATALNAGVLSTGLVSMLPRFSSAEEILKSDYNRAHDTVVLRRRITGNKIVH